MLSCLKPIVLDQQVRQLPLSCRKYYIEVCGIDKWVYIQKIL